MTDRSDKKPSPQEDRNAATMEEWLCLEDTPAWAKPVIEQAAAPAARPLVHLQVELKFAILLCVKGDEEELTKFAQDTDFPKWFRESIVAYFSKANRWQANRHIDDLQTLLTIVTDKLGYDL